MNGPFAWKRQRTAPARPKPVSWHRLGFSKRPGAVTPIRPEPAETVALITPSHRGDLERCALLFDSIDRHIKRRGQHYVIVHDSDYRLFERFARRDRQILRVSQFLPPSLTSIPFLRWRGRRYWYARGGRLISGWHAQQIVKIQAASTLPEDRFCIVDSDNVFFRDLDLSRFSAPNPIPMHVHAGGIGPHRPRHIRWVGSASRLLGTRVPRIPADDYIDQVILWDKATVQEMKDRIEAVTGGDWVEALCREREFSEYMIYGSFVASSAAARARHAATPESLCRTYWDHEVLSREDILTMIRGAAETEAALCVQSFGPTPLTTIRTSLTEYYSSLRPDDAKAPGLEPRPVVLNRVASPESSIDALFGEDPNSTSLGSAPTGAGTLHAISTGSGSNTEPVKRAG